MLDFFDFNTANEHVAYDLIPDGTIAPVRMTILRGGYDDIEQGWTGGYATHSERSGAIYLNCDFKVLRGDYYKRCLRSLIGLYSPKGPGWGSMGRSFIKSILNSAYGLKPDDITSQACEKRRLNSFDDLDEIEFVARITQELDRQEYRNVIKTAIPPGNKVYHDLMPTPYAGRRDNNYSANVPQFPDKGTYKPWMA